jgi:hypothetical protein
LFRIGVDVRAINMPAYPIRPPLHGSACCACLGIVPEVLADQLIGGLLYLLGGIVRLSQEHRDNLTTNASSLRKVMAELEQIRSEEDKVWKSLFVGDIALSPTTASVILRDATLTKDHDRVVAAIPNVNALWTSVLLKLPTSA